MKTAGLNTVWAITVMVLMFIGGAALGVAFQNTRSDAGAPPGPPPGMLSGLVEELDLSGAQAREVRAIIEHRSELTSQRMQEALDYLRAQTDSANREIRSVLDPNQSVRLDSIIQARQSQVRMRRPGP